MFDELTDNLVDERIVAHYSFPEDKMTFRLFALTQLESVDLCEYGLKLTAD